MHTDLSPHLHTEKCNQIIKLFHQCREENAFLKFFGKCDREDHQMVMCLKEERLARRQKNYEKSLQTKEKLKRLFKEDRERNKANAANVS